MLGAVVVSYHTNDELTKFLDKWVAHNEVGASLGVVLVEATEQEKKEARDLLFSHGLPALIMITEGNVGYAVACNEGARYLVPVAADTLVFFNADTELRPRVLVNCLETLWSDPSHGIVGPLQVDRQNRVVHGGIFNATKPEHRYWMRPPDDSVRDVRDDCCTVSGSAYFIKRSVWDELTACPIYQKIFPGVTGAFVPTKLFFEETFCSYHARAHNYKICFDGRDSGMIHAWHVSAKKNQLQTNQWFKESRQIFNKACQAHGIPHD